MKIWIDADACPRVIKEIIYRAGIKRNILIYLVASIRLPKHESPLVRSVEVAQGFDAADDYIVDHASREDLVITADIPLAARIVAQGGIALDPRGDLYTVETVGERLSMRDLMMELRGTGTVGGGPAPFSSGDRNKFASTLDRVLCQFDKRKGLGNSSGSIEEI